MKNLAIVFISILIIIPISIVAFNKVNSTNADILNASDFVLPELETYDRVCEKGQHCEIEPVSCDECNCSDEIPVIENEFFEKSRPECKGCC